MQRILIALITIGGLASFAAPSDAQAVLGLEASFIQRQLPTTNLTVGPNLVLLQGAPRDTSLSRVFGEMFPRLNGARPPIGSLIEVEIGGRAFVQSSTASASIDRARTQNAVSRHTFIYAGVSTFFELRADLYGASDLPAPGRAWIRVTDIITPTEIPDLTLSGPLNVGVERRVYLNRPTDAGLAFFMAATLNPRPGLYLPDQRHIPVTPDVLFYMSVGQNNKVFVQFADVLDAQGRSFEPRITVPSYDLVGLDFYVAYLTVDNSAPFGIRSISQARKLTVVP